MINYISILFIVMILFSCESKTKQADHSDNDSLYYTCSMDPQVLEKKPGKCPICKMELTPIKISNSKGIKLSEQQERLANIKTLRVGYDYIDSKVYANGVVKENENNTIFINARMDGRIDQLNFKTNGAYIKKGDIVYKIYSEMLASTQSELINANKKFQDNPNDLAMQAIMEAAIKKLELWGISKAQIEKVKKQTKPSIPFPIESPSSGYINKINITEGAIVMEGSPLIELTTYKTLWVDAEFYSTETAKIRKGSLVDVTIEGTHDHRIEGKVIEVLPQVSSNSSITIVRILIVPDFPNVQPGMQANIYWHQANEKVLMVPSNAVLRDSKGSMVWVKKGGVYESKMVHLGEISGDRASILHGLNEGDTIVISGSYLLQSEHILKKGGGNMDGHNMSAM
ncbi:efflux RND transporter periplasmic adaptor subunit [Sporocytophaga myxococcoides]|uniref:efflux RND transporter periplasmic adaptor subunit n=1 Tax=Sporocytophaga myxococcoides TaxID=153721 RepID=UPI0003F4C5FD|nr:efflux RND transporter periplasmic adaptor subunit [Sporocytophaga myxococcoides]